MLCDGRIVCGCADPTASACWATRGTTSVADIWTGPIDHARCGADLNAGGSKFCGDCPLKLPLEKDEAAAAARPRRRRRCRRACTSSAPPPATSRAPRPAARRRPASRARARPACSTSTSSRASIDEAGPSLGRIDFFNYGEAFLHKRAVEMCEYIKATFPHIYLYTSTNGLAFTEEQARRLVHSGIDEVTFSIDGASQESYEQYRQRGDFDVAIANLRAVADEKRTARPRRAVPQLALHPLHLERQRRGDGRARGDWRPRSASIACAGRSPTIPRTRSRGGSCPARRTTSASSTRSGTTTTSATRFPARRRARDIDVRAPAARPAARGARRAAAARAGRACTTSRRAPFPRRPATAGGSCASARSCATPTARVIDRDYARAWLPRRRSTPATRPTCRSRSRARRRPGRYALKFDLVSEGIDWFEACGSQTTMKPLRVW